MSKLSVLSLLVALGAAGIGAYALTKGSPDPTDLEGRLDAVEDQLSRIEARLADRVGGPETAPTLMGHSFASESAPPPIPGSNAREADGDAAAGRDALATEDPATETTTDEIQQLVDKAVEKKAAEIQTMRDKKPTIDTFAGMLDLTDEQREVVERDVVRAQHAIKAILEIPAEDGTNFIDELVEIMADGMAHPGRNPERGKKLFGRLFAEKIPGSDETYAQRVGTVKNQLRTSLERGWNEKQNATFRTWKMDPSEIKDIEGSPWKAIETRVFDRAKELGAKIPENAGG